MKGRRSSGSVGQRHAASGQALVECLVALALLVPLWWFAQQWIAGFDRRADLLRQLRVAALAQALAPGVSSAPGSAAGDVQAAATPALAGDLERAAAVLLAPATALAPVQADFDRPAWLRVTVQGSAPRGAFWSTASSPWRESLQLLVDDWSLPGPAEVAARVQSLLPSTPVEWAVNALQPLSGALALLGADLRGTCARRVDPEVIPDDRRVAAAGGRDTQSVVLPPSGWRPAC